MYLEEVTFKDAQTGEVLTTVSADEAERTTGHVDRCERGHVVVYHRGLKKYVAVDEAVVETWERKGMTPRGQGGSRPLAAEAFGR